MPAETWLERLTALVRKKPIVVLTFDEEEWSELQESRGWPTEFTIVRRRSRIAGVGRGTVTLIEALGPEGGLYVGLVRSRSAVSSAESRLALSRVARVAPQSVSDLRSLIPQGDRSLAEPLSSRREEQGLTPRFSALIVEALAGVAGNESALRALAESPSLRARVRGPVEQQGDAIRTALQAFGLTADAEARSLVLVKPQDTGLARFRVLEDRVIEHDARQVPGFELVGSDLTGRAVFERPGERLEIFTANRTPLEEAFGADLIYLNETQQNVVMLQYKMMEPEPTQSVQSDWVYRPDAKLEEQISRMRAFAARPSASGADYRLNPEVFYLKFVKRNHSAHDGAIITPLEHFEALCRSRDGAVVGPSGGRRVSHSALGGRYLREGAFLDLIRSGYVGSYSATTVHLKALITAILRSDEAVVAAIQRRATGVGSGDHPSPE